MTSTPNILLITADDMGWQTLGCYGCTTPGTTPHLDAFAATALRFERAHNTQAVCVPSRTSMQTGRYPHRFWGEIDSSGKPGYGVRSDVPTLPERLHEHGYLTAMLGKVTHHAPASKFPWDVAINHWDWERLHYARDPQFMGARAGEVMAQAKNAGQVWYLVANCLDPHRPFPGSGKGEGPVDKSAFYPEPSRSFAPDEIELPAFLPDLPDVRREYAQYLSGVRRADDSIGQILRALDNSGQAENTIVVYLTDHGSPFPFAKENCYLNSTKTPLMMRVPDRTRAGAVNQRGFVSTVDLSATLLDLLGLPNLEGSDGVSFAPLLDGKNGGRDSLVTVFHHTPGHAPIPMRGLLRGDFGYVFNAWATDGKTYTPGDPFGGLTWNAMQNAAQTDAAVASRVEFCLRRAPHELYDYASDPNALNNLIDDAKHRDLAKQMRAELLNWMREKNDPLLEQFAALQLQN